MQLAALSRGLATEWRRTVFAHPPGPKRLKVLDARRLEFVISVLVPDDTLLLLAVTESGRAWTSLAVVYRDGGFRLLTSLDAVGMEEGDLYEDALENAARELASRFGGTPGAVAIERETIDRIVASRVRVASALWP